MAVETTLVRSRYDRIAPMFDAMEWLAERSAFVRWRRELWARVPPGRVLEVGVGTGKNIEHYPRGANVVAIDISGRMLARARRRSRQLGAKVELLHMDAEKLAFRDRTFDAVVATFVFCSVPLPVRGLEEIGRVVKSDGDIWLMEHVRLDRRVIGTAMDVLNPLVVRMTGANINRRTVDNVAAAGLKLSSIENLKGELVKRIHAKP
jgi:phosphatidylethanolamine/phosphatidyl-N-methylethanolamine N-methyltransferase